VPYNPQQNGVAERKNKTICEATKAMMFDQDLPNSLWAEATSTVVHIQNRCPRAIFKDKTPEEVFSGIKPEVGHLRIFECPVYIHVPKEKRTKMEPLGEQRWNPWARKGFLWGTTRTPRLTKYMYQVKGR
jgi:hypothetical protein